MSGKRYGTQLATLHLQHVWSFCNIWGGINHIPLGRTILWDL